MSPRRIASLGCHLRHPKSTVSRRIICRGLARLKRTGAPVSAGHPVRGEVPDGPSRRPPRGTRYQRRQLPFDLDCALRAECAAVTHV